MKDVYFLSLKKKILLSQKNYRGITLTPIAAKIYNLMLLNRIRPEIDPTLRKNQNGFRTKRSTTEQMLTIRCILEVVKSKNLSATLLFIDFSKAFDSINREKMKDISIIYGIPTEIVNAILMLYKNTRSMVRLPVTHLFRYNYSSTTRRYTCTISIHYMFRLYIEKIS